MTDRTQFEAMLEALINEDQETAKEIFHNIVVGKSREIYEELLAEDFELSEKAADEEEEKEFDEAFGDEEGADDEEGSDDADDEEGSDDEEGADDFGSDEEGEGDIEDRVLDLEDALDELKAEFEQIMAGEEGGDEFGGDEFGGDDMGGDDMGGMDELDEFGMDEDPDAMDPAADPNAMMEYVNKVSPPKHGDNGVNTKSIVAKKNDMGGTVANIARGGSENGVEANKGHLKGSSVFKGTPKEDNAGNVNVPGAKSATKLSSVAKGHGAEKKGARPQEDRGAQSPLNGVKSRAK